MAFKLKKKNGEVITRDGKEVLGADFSGVVKGVNLEQRTLKIIATDETKDRDGDIITMKGWRLENYIKNPVFLWAHDYSSVPIGAAIKIQKQRNPSRLTLTHKFPTVGVHPFADMILSLYHEKVINAGSVGFLPFEWEDIDEKDEDKSKVDQVKFSKEDKFFFCGPRKFIDQELLEHSGCGVPSNPNALQDSVGAAMKSLDLKYDDKTKLYKVVTGEDYLQLDDATKENVTNEIGAILEKGAVFEEETDVKVHQVSGDINRTPSEEDLLALIKEMPGVDEALICSALLPDGCMVIYPSGVIAEVQDKELWRHNLKDGDTDAFKGLKNLFEEIFTELVAGSLVDEVDIYRRRADMLLKIGAVLNQKNKSLLKKASENILEVLENAGANDSQDADDGTVNQESTIDSNDPDKVNRFDAMLAEDEANQAEVLVVKAGDKKKTPEDKINKQLRDQKVAGLKKKVAHLVSEIDKI